MLGPGEATRTFVLWWTSFLLFLLPQVILKANMIAQLPTRTAAPMPMAMDIKGLSERVVRGRCSTLKFRTNIKVNRIPEYSLSYIYYPYLFRRLAASRAFEALPPARRSDRSGLLYWTHTRKPNKWHSASDYWRWSAELGMNNWLVDHSSASRALPTWIVASIRHWSLPSNECSLTS